MSRLLIIDSIIDKLIRLSIYYRLLIEGRCCKMLNASLICNLLESCCLCKIFVFLINCALVSAVLWMFVVCDMALKIKAGAPARLVDLGSDGRS